MEAANIPILTQLPSRRPRTSTVPPPTTDTQHKGTILPRTAAVKGCGPEDTRMQGHTQTQPVTPQGSQAPPFSCQPPPRAPIVSCQAVFFSMFPTQPCAHPIAA